MKAAIIAKAFTGSILIFRQALQIVAGPAKPPSQHYFFVYLSAREAFFRD